MPGRERAHIWVAYVRAFAQCLLKMQGNAEHSIAQRLVRPRDLALLRRCWCCPPQCVEVRRRAFLTSTRHHVSALASYCLPHQAWLQACMCRILKVNSEFSHMFVCSCA